MWKRCRGTSSSISSDDAGRLSEAHVQRDRGNAQPQRVRVHAAHLTANARRRGFGPGARITAEDTAPVAEPTASHLPLSLSGLHSVFTMLGGLRLVPAS